MNNQLYINEACWKILLLTEGNSDTWDNFVRSHPNRSFTHRREFCEAMRIFWGGENKSFLIINPLGEVEAIFPLISKSRRINTPIGNLLRINGSFGYSDGGPLLRQDSAITEEILFLFLKKVLTKRSKWLTRIKIDYGINSINRNNYSKFAKRAIKTLPCRIIDLSENEQYILNSFRNNHKRNLAKAQRDKSLKFRFATRSDFEDYYKFHVASYTRGNLKPHNKDYFRYIFDRILDSKNCLIGCVEDLTGPINFVNYAMDGELAFYWTGVGSSAGYEKGANFLCHWEMIKETKIRNFRYLDLGEIESQSFDRKRKSIEHFKAGFGSLIMNKVIVEIEFGIFGSQIFKIIRRNFFGYGVKSEKLSD